MKIGFDLSITKMNQAGAAVYTQSLFDALQGIGTNVEWVTFSTNQQRQMGKQKNAASRIKSLRHDLLWHNVTLPWQAYRAQIDILHNPAYITPFKSPCPVVVSILDVLPIKSPETFTFWHRNHSRLFLPFLSRRAAAIITISNQSRNDIIEYLRVSPDRVFVTYLAASPQFRLLPKHEIAQGKEKYGLDQFVLSVCTLEPRKNIIRAIQAFSQIKRAGYPHKFVHVGAKGWLYNEIFAEVERLNLQNEVCFLGRVSAEDLGRLYNAAALFIYPSLHEGFGIPILEAMSCGTPVITSNVSSMPEVAGDAALLINPTDTYALADAMQYLLADEALQVKKREEGLNQSRLFSWQRCAEETIQVYRKIL